MNINHKCYLKRTTVSGRARSSFHEPMNQLCPTCTSIPRRSLAQRRKGAKRYRVSKIFLCAFAREMFLRQRCPEMQLSTFLAKPPEPNFDCDAGK